MGEQVYFSRRDFAERIGVSARTLQRWEHQGILRPLRIGGRLLYTDDLLFRADRVRCRVAELLEVEP